MNSDFIEIHNSADDGATFTLGHNQFSHLSWEEFKETVSAARCVLVRKSKKSSCDAIIELVIRTILLLMVFDSPEPRMPNREYRESRVFSFYLQHIILTVGGRGW